MTTKLIRYGIVISMDPSRRVLEGGCVLIDDDRIAGVHEDSSSLSADGVDEVIDAHRHAVMPGLIDSHGHAGHALMKNVGVGRGKAWADACVHVYSRGSSADFWRAEARLASLERLKACVTTSVSLLGGGTDLIRNDTPDYALAYANAVGEAGTRAWVAATSSDRLNPASAPTLSWSICSNPISCPSTCRSPAWPTSPTLPTSQPCSSMARS